MSMYPSNYYRPSPGQYGGPNSFGMNEQVPSGNPFGRRQRGDGPFNPFNRPQQQDYYAPQNQFNRYQQNFNNRSGNRFIEQQSYSNPYQQQQPYFDRSQRQRPYFTPYQQQQQQPQPQQLEQQQLEQQQFQPQPPRRPPLQDTLNSLMSHADKVTHGVNMLRQMSTFLSSFR